MFVYQNILIIVGYLLNTNMSVLFSLTSCSDVQCGHRKVHYKLTVWQVWASMETEYSSALADWLNAGKFIHYRREMKHEQLMHCSFQLSTHYITGD